MLTITLLQQGKETNFSIMLGKAFVRYVGYAKLSRTKKGMRVRIAVASKNLEVAPRLEHCESFMCYRVEHGVISGCQNMPNFNLSVPESIDLLLSLGVDVLIAGSVSVGVARQYCDADIEVVAGTSGSSLEVARQYLTDTLIGADEMCSGDDESSGAEYSLYSLPL